MIGSKEYFEKLKNFSSDRIDWSPFSELRIFMDSKNGSIMRGEEKTLSDEEIAELQSAMNSMSTSLQTVKALFKTAQERYKNK